MDFSHFNESGRARMVNVGEKQETKRTAIAAGRVLVSRETLELIRTGGLKKGDVLGTAQIGGIMGAKNTPHIIPMCHPIMITGVDIDFRLNDEDCAVEITATTSCTGATGVEMEALTGVSAALLTVYDMCKALDKTMELTGIHLVHKEGGKSGVFHRG